LTIIVHRTWAWAASAQSLCGDMNDAAFLVNAEKSMELNPKH
jgi:hypothetical protein